MIVRCVLGNFVVVGKTNKGWSEGQNFTTTLTKHYGRGLIEGWTKLNSVKVLFQGLIFLFIF